MKLTPKEQDFVERHEHSPVFKDLMEILDRVAQDQLAYFIDSPPDERLFQRQGRVQSLMELVDMLRGD